MKYKISRKNPEGSQYKYSKIGSVEIREGQNPRISIKNTSEFQDFVKDTPHEDWLKLYLFEDKPKEEAHAKPTSSGTELDDEIPW